MLRKNRVSTQNAESLSLDRGKEMPTPITVLDLEEKRRAQRAHLAQKRSEKAR